MSEQISRKRRLEPSSDSDEERTRSRQVIKSDIWFEDGNIILQAKDTQFRVHMGILAKNSPALKELFKRSRFQHPTKTPILQVVADAGVQDVRHFLNALYDSTYLFKLQRDNQRLPISAVIGLVRMAQNYGFRELRDIAVAPLRQEFPLGFEEWMNSDRSSFDFIKVDEDETETALLKLLQLAVECRIQTILPQIYLDVFSHIDWECIRHGIEPDNKEAAPFLLPVDIQASCLYGFHELRDLLPSATYGWLRQIPYSACTSGAGKTRKCANAIGKLYLETLGSEWRHNGLEPWDKTWSALLCTGCSTAAQKDHESGRREVWEKLPTLFGLRPWTELVDF